MHFIRICFCWLAFFFLLLPYCNNSFGQASISLGTDKTLSCDTPCTTLTASISGLTGATDSYTIDSTGITFSDHYSFSITSSTGILSGDDYYSTAISLPFDFCFYGQTYSSLVIGINGNIAFDASLASGFCPWDIDTIGGIPSGSYDFPAIMGCYGDWVTATTATAKYIVQGTAPNRVFIVNFYNVEEFTCTSDKVTFQMVLHETSNIIDIFIKDKPICTSWNHGKAICGIEKNGSTALAVPGRNGTVWGGTGLNLAYRFIPSGAPIASLYTSSGTLVATDTTLTSTGPGTYTASFSSICPSSDTSKYIAAAYGVGCDSTAIFDTINVFRGSLAAPSVITPVNYCVGATASPLSATAADTLKWYTTASGGTGSYTAPMPSTSTAGTFHYYVSQVNGSCESPRSMITVNVNAIPATPAITSTSPVCTDHTLTLTASSSTSGVIFKWRGPSGFTATGASVSIDSVTTADAGVYYVKDSLFGCTSDTISTTVVIHSSPLISGFNTVNPSTCLSSDGSITLTGLVASTTYTVYYTKSSIVHSLTITADASGDVTISGLAAGAYYDISVSDSFCSSNVITESIILSNPSAPPPPIAGSNSPICADSTLALTATDTSSTASYSWSGPSGFSSTLQNPVISSTTGTNAGIYSVTITIGGCISSPATTTVVINPTPALTTTTLSNPTTCLGSDGSITLNGLTPGTTYSVTYNKDGIISTVSITANASGQVIISGLSAGSVTNIGVSASGCPSNTLAGPYTLSDPLPPAVPAASSNSPVCADSVLQLVATDATAGSITYSWSGPDGFSSTMADPSVAHVSSVNVGVYSVTASLHGCTSVPTTVVVVVNETPVISGISFTNPSVCGGSDGTITLDGLDPDSSYVVHYFKGSATHTITLTANSSGQIVITGLGTGSYSSFTAELNGCTSAAVGPIVLSDPSAPVISFISNSGPVCAGSSITFSTAFVAGAIYNWSGPAGFSSTLQDPVIASTIAADSGAYVLTITVSGCTSNPDTTDAIIYRVPAMPVIVTNSPLCADSTLAMTASDSSSGVVSYSWFGPGGFADTGWVISISDASSSTMGTYSVVASEHGCTSDTATTTVMVYPTPYISSITRTEPTSCTSADGTFTLHGLTPDTTYTVYYNTLSGLHTLTLTANALGAVTVTGLASGAYTNIHVSNLGCPSNAIGSLTLYSPGSPSIPVLGSNSPICAGDTLLLTAVDDTAGASYSWSGPAFSVADTMQNPVLAGAATTDAGVYTVTVTKHGCTATDTVGVIIKPLPATPVATATSPVCSGEAINFTASGTDSASYNWSGPGGFTSTLEDPVISSATIAMSGVYTVVSIFNGCSSGSGTVHVVVHTTPAAPSVHDTTYCQFATAVPLTVTGTSIHWYANDTTTAFTITAPTPSTDSVGIFVYYVTQTADGCESHRAAIHVTITPASPPPATATNSPVCAGSELTLATPAVAGATYSWSGPHSFTSTLQNLSFTADTSKEGIYSLTVSIDGCISQTAYDTVIVVPLPPAPVTDTAFICQGSSPVSLSAAGVDLLWYTADTGGTGSSSAPIINPTVPDTVVWYVSQSIHGCEGPRAVLTAITLYSPVSSIFATRRKICQGDTMTFVYDGASVPDGGIFYWGLPTGATIVAGSKTSPDSIYVQFNVPGTLPVTLSVSDKGDRCTSTDTINVEITPAPTMKLFGDTAACPGDQVIAGVTDGSVGIGYYSWNFDGATIVSSSADAEHSGPYKLSWENPGVYFVQVIAINDSACRSLPQTDTVTIHPLPIASIAGISKDNVCAGDSVLVTAQDIDTTGIYLWSAPYLKTDTGFARQYIVAENTGYITLNVISNFGCSASDSALITTQPCCDVFFSTAFTPNHDGKNDVFRPITVGHHRLSIFRVVNRWGQTVFSTTSEREGWDGTFHGVEQEVGVYYYYMKYTCATGRSIEEKGEVTLIR